MAINPHFQELKKKLSQYKGNTALGIMGIDVDDTDEESHTESMIGVSVKFKGEREFFLMAVSLVFF